MSAEKLESEGPCVGGAWGNDDCCLIHEGHELDRAGLCLEGRAIAAKAWADKREADFRALERIAEDVDKGTLEGGYVRRAALVNEMRTRLRPVELLDQAVREGRFEEVVDERGRVLVRPSNQLGLFR